MEIKDEHIARAEQLLLLGGAHFDEERIRFIKRLDSGDLLAVPGSGKTTTLRAKLFCIAKELPLNGGRGILALSHTNVAVDELKRMLQNHCPQLFEYPSFVGTIQEFVDNFLALPYYVQKYGHREDIIDADRYEQECVRIMSRPGRQTAYLARKLQYGKDYRKIRLGYSEDGRRILRFGLEGMEVTIDPEPKWIRENTVAEKTEEMMGFLFRMKETIMQYGILHFDDCYYLAETNIRDHPDIIDILRNRFAFVFVDEAQDMKSYQLDLIDKCFDCDDVVLQRIGDPNQAIFDGFSVKNSWVSRKPYFINNSLRLTPEVASIVDHLVIDRGDNGQGGALFVVNGIRALGNPIRPHLLLYKQETVGELKVKFRELIQRYRLNESPEARRYGFHIVGWNAESTGRIDARRLEDIFPEYHRKLNRPNASPDSLSFLVQQGKNLSDFNESRKTVLEAYVKVLNAAGIKPDDGRQFTVNKVFRMLREKDRNIQQQFLEELLDGTMKLSKGIWSEAYVRIKELTTKWLADFYHQEPNVSVNAFYGDAYTQLIVDGDVDDINVEEIPLNIGTVHSVKGMTHCATMYVETSYNRKYESQYVIDDRTIGRGKNKVRTVTSPFLHQDLNAANGNASMAKRMLYVGFSRPTHLLCYASDKNIWDKDVLRLMCEAGWVIEEV